jgi:hypothetical protein
MVIKTKKKWNLLFCISVFIIGFFAFKGTPMIFAEAPSNAINITSGITNGQIITGQNKTYVYTANDFQFIQIELKNMAMNLDIQIISFNENVLDYTTLTSSNQLGTTNEYIEVYNFGNLNQYFILIQGATNTESSNFALEINVTSMIPITDDYTGNWSISPGDKKIYCHDTKITKGVFFTSLTGLQNDLNLKLKGNFGYGYQEIGISENPSILAEEITQNFTFYDEYLIIEIFGVNGTVASPYNLTIKVYQPWIDIELNDDGATAANLDQLGKYIVYGMINYSNGDQIDVYKITPVRNENITITLSEFTVNLDIFVGDQNLNPFGSEFISLNGGLQKEQLVIPVNISTTYYIVVYAPNPITKTFYNIGIHFPSVYEWGITNGTNLTYLYTNEGFIENPNLIKTTIKNVFNNGFDYAITDIYESNESKNGWNINLEDLILYQSNFTWKTYNFYGYEFSGMDAYFFSNMMEENEYINLVLGMMAIPLMAGSVNWTWLVKSAMLYLPLRYGAYQNTTSLINNNLEVEMITNWGVINLQYRYNNSGILVSYEKRINNLLIEYAYIFPGVDLSLNSTYVEGEEILLEINYAHEEWTNQVKYYWSDTASAPDWNTQGQISAVDFQTDLQLFNVPHTLGIKYLHIYIDSKLTSPQKLCFSITITANTASSLTNPPDFNFSGGTVGNTINWTITDPNVGRKTEYMIFANGSFYSFGNWANNTPFFVNLDSLTVGIWNITIIAHDGLGFNVNDSANVTVLNVNPMISTPPDITFNKDIGINNVTWTIFDHTVGVLEQFIIYWNGIEVDFGTWNNTKSITFNLDWLPLGVWIISINITDGFGGNTSDSVIVDVYNLAPNITSPADIEYIFGSSGNHINWTATDENSPTIDFEFYVNNTYNSLVSNVENNSIYRFDLGLGVGIWNITVIVYDAYGYRRNDTVFVTVIFVNLTISAPVDRNYMEGTTGNTITWTIIDSQYNMTNTSYRILRNGIQVKTGTWVFGTTIIHSMDGLTPNVYNFTLIASDGYEEIAQDTVIVTVLAQFATDTTTRTARTTTSTNTSTTTSSSSTSSSSTSLPSLKDDDNGIAGYPMALIIIGIATGIGIIGKKRRI